MAINGGIDLQRKPYSTHAKDIFDIAIDHRRSGLVLPSNASKGARFNDNTSVLARLESMSTENDFIKCPGIRIDSALIDAASSDYWYQTEKKYDYEYYESEETEIVDEE
jgi:hypothetical protein